MNYNANDDPVSAVMNDNDVDGNAHIEELAFDSSGNSRTVEYTIDTSNNPDGYEDITDDNYNRLDEWIKHRSFNSTTYRVICNS